MHEAINQLVTISASELRQNILVKNEHGWSPEEAWLLITELSKGEKESFLTIVVDKSNI